MSKKRVKLAPQPRIAKSPTGIVGLDQITEGGLPQGRPTLVCGGAGCGKTILAMEFLVRGATQFNEPGVFVSFEETDKELAENVASMGFDLNQLCAQKKLFLDHVKVERSDVEETGEYDLEGLFVRLEHAINSVGARRVALDTLESLFSSFSNTNILRAELRRLFRWLKSKGVTAVITAEAGGGKLTRQGIEEYVADCVIVLDHRVQEQSSIRRLRVLKYRGTTHGTNEYPFLIGSSGFSVLPLSSLKLEYPAPTERVSTGIPGLDAMLGGKGFFRGTSALISGAAGTGKSSMAAHFVNAACRRGEKALYQTSEQSPAEIIRNMRSIGIDLEPWVKRGLLHFFAARPGTFGMEKYLVTLNDVITDFSPKVVVIDPITGTSSMGSYSEIRSMLTRVLDLLKSRQITAMFTSLISEQNPTDPNEIGVSSLMDAWLLLRNLESNGERNRGLYVLKARGMAHSNQVREFVLTDRGVQLLDVYLGPAGMLTGSARLAQVAKEAAEANERQHERENKSYELQQKRQQMEMQIRQIRANFEMDERRLRQDISGMEGREKQVELTRLEMADSRGQQTPALQGNGRR